MAAIIVGASIIAGSFIVKMSLDETVTELDAVVTALKERPAPVAPAPQPTARRRGPDPAKRYEIDLGDAPVKGPESAQVTIVEWSDFQCPFCRRTGPTLDQVRSEYGENVRVVFKHLPLGIHPKAPAAHAAAEAANRQGKFWEMHDKIFDRQPDMSPELYLEFAKELELDIDQYQKDLTSAEVKRRIDGDSQMASSLGVTGTPAFFINGRYMAGAKPFASFKQLIDEELAKN